MNTHRQSPEELSDPLLSRVWSSYTCMVVIHLYDRHTPSGWDAAATTPHPDGLASLSNSADQEQSPGDHGSCRNQKAVIDRGFFLAPTVFSHPHHLLSRHGTVTRSRTAPELEVTPSLIQRPGWEAKNANRSDWVCCTAQLAVNAVISLSSRASEASDECHSRRFEDPRHDRTAGEIGRPAVTIAPATSVNALLPGHSK